MREEIKKLKEEQALLREMVDIYKATGVPSLDVLKRCLEKNTWNLKKIQFKLKKLKEQE